MTAETIIKYVLYGAVIIVVWYNTNKYWERQDKADMMLMEQFKRDTERDSIKMVNDRLSWEIEQLREVKAQEKTNRTIYETNYKKRAEVTKNSTYADDRDYVEQFIRRFEPKWVPE